MIIFGDSHIALYFDLIGIRTVHLGPVLMHRMGRDGLASCGVDASAALPGETIGLVCGEIDIRVHFAKQRRLGRSAGEIVGDVSDRYSDAVAAFRDQTDAQIAIFCVTPPAAITYPSFDPMYPRNGTDEERVLWTFLLNARLRSKAAKHGYIFVDQHHAFADAEGLLGLTFSGDGVHIDRRYADLVDLSHCLSHEIEGSMAKFNSLWTAGAMT